MKRYSAIALVLLAASFAQAQSAVTGEVVEVINGKTVMLMLPAGKTLVELQYVEVPEPEQQLHSTVVAHLKKLVVGRRAEYKAIRMLRNGGTVGRLVIDGVDVSQQMLRDGAAWHLPIEKTGQEAIQFSDYATSERFAREEKRGVWGVDGMKPAWEFRADRKAAEAAKAFSKSNGAIASYPPNTRRKGYWSDVNPMLKNIGAFASGYNASTRTGYVSTTLLGLSQLEGALPIDAKTAIEVTYVYQEFENKPRKGNFVFAVLSSSGRWQYLKENTLDVFANEKQIRIGKPKREATEKQGEFYEKLTYSIDRAMIERIANADDAYLKIGNQIIKPRFGMQQLLFNMLQATK